MATPHPIIPSLSSQQPKFPTTQTEGAWLLPVLGEPSPVLHGVPSTTPNLAMLNSHAKKEGLRMESLALNTFETAESISRLTKHHRLSRVFGLEPDEPNQYLCYLAEHIEARIASLTERRLTGIRLRFSIDQLDRIADDGKIDDDLEENVRIDEHEWLDDFRICLGWWEDTAKMLVDANEPDDNSRLLPRPENEKERNEICRLLSDVYEAYVPALKSGYSFDRNWDDNIARLNLLKRYRLFTRYVCTLAQQVWPHVNLSKLLEQV